MQSGAAWPQTKKSDRTAFPVVLWRKGDLSGEFAIRCHANFAPATGRTVYSLLSVTLLCRAFEHTNWLHGLFSSCYFFALARMRGKYRFILGLVNIFEYIPSNTVNAICSSVALKSLNPVRRSARPSSFFVLEFDNLCSNCPTR